MEWKLLYVGNAEDSEYDQVLEEVMVGPVVQGIHKFVFQAPAPNHEKILNEDLIGVTVVLLTCEYRFFKNVMEIYRAYFFLPLF